MQDFLSNPAVQAALIPLLVGTGMAFALGKWARLWQGVAITAGFLTTVLLTTGLSFHPLMATNKLILTSLGLPFLALVLARIHWKGVWQKLSLAILPVIASIWIVWPVLMRQEGWSLWQTGGSVALYAATITMGLLWTGAGVNTRQAGAVISLGLCGGGASILSASALYGQLSIAVAAAAGGVLLIQLFNRFSGQFGHLAMYAAATPLALLGGAATIYAKLPAMALLCLVLVPAFAAIPAPKRFNPWLSAAFSVLMGLLPGLVAIWLSWDTAEPLAY